MTIHPTKHIDYSRGDRVDHLFVVGEAGPTPAETALLVSVTDTGLDCVLDDQTAGWRDRTGTKGWSLTWAEVIAAVQESDHNGVVTLTTVRSTADDVDESIEDPRLCDCGKGDWCPLWDSWTGPGKDERDERVKEDDDSDSVVLVEHTGTLEEFQTEMAALRQRSVGGVDILQWKHDGDPVIVVLTEEQAEQLQDLLNTSPTLTEDHPALVHLDLGLGL